MAGGKSFHVKKGTGFVGSRPNGRGGGRPHGRSTRHRHRRQDRNFSLFAMAGSSAQAPMENATPEIGNSVPEVLRGLVDLKSKREVKFSNCACPPGQAFKPVALEEPASPDPLEQPGRLPPMARVALEEPASPDPLEQPGRLPPMAPLPIEFNFLPHSYEGMPCGYFAPINFDPLQMAHDFNYARVEYVPVYTYSPTYNWVFPIGLAAHCAQYGDWVHANRFFDSSGVLFYVEVEFALQFKQGLEKVFAGSDVTVGVWYGAASVSAQVRSSAEKAVKEGSGFTTQTAEGSGFTTQPAEGSGFTTQSAEMEILVNMALGKAAAHAEDEAADGKAAAVTSGRRGVKRSATDDSSVANTPSKKKSGPAPLPVKDREDGTMYASRGAYCEAKGVSRTSYRTLNRRITNEI